MRNRKPTYVLDATPLIHFAKIGKLSLILDICEAYITREVYRETVERGGGAPDATVIRDAVGRRELKIYEIRDRRIVGTLQRHAEIHTGEAETLAAAKELGALAVVDEAEARAIAKTYGIPTGTGTLFLLFRLVMTKQIETQTCLSILDQLVESGLYIDAQTLMRARNRIKEFIDPRGSKPTLEG